MTMPYNKTFAVTSGETFYFWGMGPGLCFAYLVYVEGKLKFEGKFSEDSFIQTEIDPALNVNYDSNDNRLRNTFILTPTFKHSSTLENCEGVVRVAKGYVLFWVKIKEDYKDYKGEIKFSFVLNLQGVEGGALHGEKDLEKHGKELFFLNGYRPVGGIPYECSYTVSGIDGSNVVPWKEY